MFGAKASDSKNFVVKIWIVFRWCSQGLHLWLKIIEIIADFIMNLILARFQYKQIEKEMQILDYYLLLFS